MGEAMAEAFRKTVPDPIGAASSPPALSIVADPEPETTPAAGPTFRRNRYARRPKLGAILLARRLIGSADLARTLMTQRQLSCNLGEIVMAEGLVEIDAMTRALGAQYAMGEAGPAPRNSPASDALARKMTAEQCFRYRAIPWRRIGGLTMVATADPSRVDKLREDLPPSMGDVLFAVVSDRDLDQRIAEIHGDGLARAAECRTPEAFSCRRLRARRGAAVMACVLLLLVLLAALWPVTAFRVATVLAVTLMVATLGLRLAATLAARRDDGPRFASARPHHPALMRPPCISIVVPLHDEPDIAAPLTERLSRLDYPRALLEVALVVEASDARTRDALARADLPRWMRVIVVPDGQPRTKPRAMNYALPFLRGEIIGIYDAEDAPSPDQLHRIAARFAAAPSRVACLQGYLDYYNPNRNWMSRCFTIEYAGWFRQMLPGIARLGFVVPLGGTTVFFRRAALERVGGWDAHNVTEDADLGVRLARLGYRTEIIPTTTLEEANAAPIAWVKQRSRWMKGYMLTWVVHMRRPRRLLSELGPKRFWAFHLQFLGAIANALLAPLQWSLLLPLFGVHHPILDWLPSGAVPVLAVSLAGLGLLNVWLGIAACSAPHHRHLRVWVATAVFYHPLATLAVIKALIELVARPFHWDKTIHGVHGGTAATTGDLVALEGEFGDALPSFARRAG
jgi:cellulose synthase/poly-beta-1,6-N-acetylglucosamine synthase-like glycosyltransferase